MKIYFIRHAQTDWNTKKLLNGTTDITLNDNGRLQAMLTGEYLSDKCNCNKIISSPLIRAIETANCINKYINVEILTDSRISERNFGKWEGIPVENIKFDEMEEDMEPHFKVSYRVNSFLRDLVKKNSEKDTIFVITHGTILRHIFTAINRSSYQMDNYHNASISSVEYDTVNKAWSINNFNDITHIEVEDIC